MNATQSTTLSKHHFYPLNGKYATAIACLGCISWVTISTPNPEIIKNIQCQCPQCKKNINVTIKHN
jgi:hypothetical protein